MTPKKSSSAGTEFTADRSGGSSVVRIRDLSFLYGEGDSAFLALNDISVEIKSGEMVAITGASGSGKSTLMNLLGTLATTQDGVLEIEATSVADLSDDELAGLRNRHIGFIFQQFHLLPRLTVLENVMLPVNYALPRVDADERSRLKIRALSLLARLGIADQAHKLPATLSGGQKQRVAIARALLMDARILLADEPTGALDSRTSKEVLRIFAELNEEGRTIIIITHDPAVTMITRRRIELRDGRVESDVIQAGMNKEDILADNATPATAPQPPTESRFHRTISRFLNPWRDAWQALFSSRLRTILTSLGLIIGVSSITIMLTLGDAAQKVILGIFNQAGSDRIYVGLDFRAARTSTGYWVGLDVDNELPSMQNTFASYGRIVPLGDSSTQNVFAAGNAFETRIQSLYSAHDFVDKGMKITAGRMIAPHEFADGDRVALIGSDFADEMFPKQYPGRFLNQQFPVGEELSLRGSIQSNVTVVGVVGKRDTTFESNDVNSRVFIPMTMASKYTGKNKVTWMAVVPNEGVSHRWLADAVTNYLSIKTGLRYPFRAHVPEEIISRIMLFIKVFQWLTALIGGLCILVGGIGIMNIMLVTITERIKEIGLRKALGAREGDIARQFLLECVLLCSASGIAGALIGFVFCNFVAFAGHQALPETIPGQMILNPTGIIAGILTAIVSGVAFGVMPALKAARMDPSEALRSE
jgi:macrolide transport system ATP-binding/permease protein